jgi:hypothetical protein
MEISGDCSTTCDLLASCIYNLVTQASLLSIFKGFWDKDGVMFIARWTDAFDWWQLHRKFKNIYINYPETFNGIGISD